MDDGGWQEVGAKPSRADRKKPSANGYQQQPSSYSSSSSSSGWGGNSTPSSYPASAPRKVPHDTSHSASSGVSSSSPVKWTKFRLNVDELSSSSSDEDGGAFHPGDHNDDEGPPIATKRTAGKGNKNGGVTSTGSRITGMGAAADMTKDMGKLTVSSSITPKPSNNRKSVKGGGSDGGNHNNGQASRSKSKAKAKDPMDIPLWAEDETPDSDGDEAEATNSDHDDDDTAAATTTTTKVTGGGRRVVSVDADYKELTSGFVHALEKGAIPRLNTPCPLSRTGLSTLEEAKHLDSDEVEDITNIQSLPCKGCVRGFNTWRSYEQHVRSFQDPYHRALARHMEKYYLPKDPTNNTAGATPWEKAQESMVKPREVFTAEHFDRLAKLVPMTRPMFSDNQRPLIEIRKLGKAQDGKSKVIEYVSIKLGEKLPDADLGNRIDFKNPILQLSDCFLSYSGSGFMNKALLEFTSTRKGRTVAQLLHTFLPGTKILHATHDQDELERAYPRLAKRLDI